MLRKPQCDFGWDWNIALAPLGLHGRIGLSAPSGEIARRAHPPGPPRPPRPRRRSPSHVRSFAPTPPTGRSPLGGRRPRPAPCRSPAAAAPSTTSLIVENPALWWPAGVGAQPIHDLDRPGRRPARTLPRRAPRHPPRLRARRHRPQLRPPRQRPPGLRPRRQLDPGRRPARPHHRGEDPRPPAVGRRRQHEHDPGLGRRPLRAGELLRGLRRPRAAGLAGLHVRLPPLPGDRRTSSPRSTPRSPTRRPASATTSPSGAATTNCSAPSTGSRSRGRTATATSSPTTA